MSNDDLGQFPSPSDNSTPTPPLAADPVTPSIPPSNPDTSSLPPVATQEVSPANTFEETPDEIPSTITPPIAPSSPLPVESQPPVAETTQHFPPTEAPPSAPRLEPMASPIPATIPSPKGGSAFGSLIAVVLLLVSGVALAVTVFLFSQSKLLRQQLSEVTQTLEQQRTTITPTPTPTIIDFPTPSLTPEATESAPIVPSITPAPTATPSTATTALPLAGASQALKVAINHLPNAQMIIIKTENATSKTQSITKYFFRQDLTTKKYFYVLVADNKSPEIVDKAIYVTPDNNIPSLNDLVTGSTLGIDLDEAIKIANATCTSKLCETATVKAQYIKSGTSTIWQLTFTPLEPSKSPLIAQINSTTKEILYKSTGF